MLLFLDNPFSAFPRAAQHAVVRRRPGILTGKIPDSRAHRAPSGNAGGEGFRASLGRRMLFRIVVCAVVVLAALPARAQPGVPGEFYEGKTITLVTSTGVGGTYDVIARLIARHMPRHIPGNPAMIVQNMPGGGNVLATNYMFAIAPKDGTTIATIHNAMPLHQVLDGQGVRYDARKFNWLGSTGPENEVILVWHSAGIKTLQDLMSREVILGGTGAGSGIVIIPTVMNNLLGTRFKIVTGYKSSEDVNLALQRGEVEARAFSWGSITAQRPDWIAEKKIVVLAQAGAHREKDLPDVPLLSELSTTEEQRQILQLISSAPGLGHPFIAPPGVTADRVATLRNAFDSTMKDKAFLADADKLMIEIDPVSAEEVARIVADTIDAPPEVIGKAKAAMATPAR
jgi:tripartite-type tricarboxylate transporter receptor subunit TctC